jgi:hypothetical protein
MMTIIPIDANIYKSYTIRFERYHLLVTQLLPRLYKLLEVEEMKEKLNDIDYVLEVMGDYTGSGASIGPQHDLGDWKKIKDKVTHK